MNPASRHFLNHGLSGFFENRIFYWHRLIILAIFYAGLNIPVYAQDLDDVLKAGNEYYEKEQYHSAAQFYQVATGLQNDHAETYYRLAQCYRAIFNYPMAAIYYRKTLEIDGNSYPLASFYLAQMQKSLGNFKVARDEFQFFIDNNTQRSALPDKEKINFLNRAKTEIEGCLWAIEQLGKSWTEMGFAPLPEPVNSVSNDYAAVSDADDQVITITSGKKGAKGGLVDNRFGEYFTDNIRYGNQGGGWAHENLSDHFDRTNTKFSDGVGTYNANGDKYYFTSCHDGNAFCKLYVAYKENGIWKNPELLNDNVNAPGFDNKHPTLTVEGDTLIFTSNRPGGPGGNDLWYCVSNDGESWSKAALLPGEINTPFNEVSPFYYKDNLLFFSSDGHSGMGGMDIFMARLSNDSTSSIQNLGTPFNSGYDDSFFSLGSEKGYMSSNRPQGMGKFDIYSFNLPGQDADLANFLEESAEGTQLRSRIRDSDGSSLYAARDEDQFYYDNLSAEERARLERILDLKQEHLTDFNPSELTKEDYKYYRKLDIGTQATIARLAQMRTREITNKENQLTLQEKLDWEYYQNIDEQEKEIIDRIIDNRVEARRSAILKLSPEEQLYTSNPSNQERIEGKVQLQTLALQAASLKIQQPQGMERLTQNQSVLSASTIDKTVAQLDTESIQSRSEDYTGTVGALSLQHQLVYQELAPKERDDLHKSALRGFILNHQKLTLQQKDKLLSELYLVTDPQKIALANRPEQDQVLLMQIGQALTENMTALNVLEEHVSVKEQVIGELVTQQLILQRHLEELSKRVASTTVLHDEITQYLQEQQNSSQPLIEENIVEEFLTHSLQLLPLLTPKQTFYFNTLNPSHQLRINRLTRLVDEQTKELQKSATGGGQYIAHQNASDQWYYFELSPGEQEIVDKLVTGGWSPNKPYGSEEQAFITGLSQIEIDRIDRMMGNQGPTIIESDEYHKLIAQSSASNKQSSVRNAQSSVSNMQSSVRNAQSSVSNMQSSVPNAQSSVSNAQSSVFNAQASETVDRGNPQTIAREEGLDQVDYLGAKIYFDIDQHTLRTEAKKALSDLVAFLATQEKPVKIIIEGHADNMGSITHNDQLSRNRSQSAVEFLEPLSGLVEITSRSYGEEMPASENSTALGRQLNRRVELKIQGIPYQSPLQVFLIKPEVTLEMITEATGLLEEDIMKWNGLQQSDLQHYQPLRLPVNLDYRSIRHLVYRSKKYRANYHTVQAGENLFRLAKRYNTSVQALEELNNITASELQAGQQLRLR